MHLSSKSRIHSLILSLLLAHAESAGHLTTILYLVAGLSTEQGAQAAPEWVHEQFPRRIAKGKFQLPRNYTALSCPADCHWMLSYSLASCLCMCGSRGGAGKSRFISWPCAVHQAAAHAEAVLPCDRMLHTSVCLDVPRACMPGCDRTVPLQTLWQPEVLSASRGACQDLADPDAQGGGYLEACTAHNLLLSFN